MKYLIGVAKLLVIIGALNWGLVGLLNFNLVNSLLGSNFISQIIYCLVGLSAIVLVVYNIIKHKKKK